MIDGPIVTENRPGTSLRGCHTLDSSERAWDCPRYVWVIGGDF
jgi:hypothetical protein